MTSKSLAAFLSDYFRHQTEVLQQEVQDMPESQLAAFSETTILDGLTQKYTITPLAID